MRENTVMLSQPAVSAMTHVTLSLRGAGGNMRNFRMATKTILLRRAKVIRDRQPAALVRARNLEKLNKVLPNTPGNRVRRNLIMATFPGDWECRDVEVFPMAGESDTDAILRVVGRGAGLLVGAGPRSFPSRNFVHSEDAVNWFVCLDQVHYTFSDTYTEFCKMMGDKTDLPKLGRPFPALAGPDAPAAIEDGEANADADADQEPDAGRQGPAGSAG